MNVPANPRATLRLDPLTALTRGAGAAPIQSAAYAERSACAGPPTMSYPQAHTQPWVVIDGLEREVFR